MVINSNNVFCDEAKLSHGILNQYKHGNLPERCSLQMDFMSEDSKSSLGHRPGKYNSLECKSPYLKNSNHRMMGDSVKLLSRVTEKRIVHKNGAQILSSFPLAGNIYKVNSDEIKAKPSNKKVLKSVLTLPNSSSPLKQLRTVSDLNAIEFLNGHEDLRKKTKKSNLHHTRKFRPFSKGLALESQYFNEIDGNLGCISSDTVKKCGDGKRIHKAAESKSKAKEKVKPHDVWAVLRNMNRFQFQPSPEISEDSFILGEQKKHYKRRNNRNDLRVYETRRTEEIAYISSYNVEKSSSLSRCSSFDKVTVIDKNQDYTRSKVIEGKSKKKKSPKIMSPARSNSKYLPNNRNSPLKRNNLKEITYLNHTNQMKNNTDNAENASSFVICPNYSEIKVLMNNNASVDLGYESKTTENDEDFISFETTSTKQAECQSQSKLSDNSGSSKAAAFKKRVIQTKDKFNTKEDFEKEINGITKVILKGQHEEQSVQNKVDIFKRSTRKAAVFPRNIVTPPKLTKTEINRQLHKYKFPVVILGKDQLRSSLRVVSEHPQFDGLDEQIWPFMKTWYGIEEPMKAIKKQPVPNVQNHKENVNGIEKKPWSKYNVQKPTKVVDKTPIEHKRVPKPLTDIINLTENPKKLRPMRQLKDRMLKLLYKNSSLLNVVDKSATSTSPPREKQNNNMVVEICTNTQNNCVSNSSIPKIKKSRIPKCIEKHPWAKAKWASDFIDNVIKKIKSGTYYSQESVNKIYKEEFIIDKKEMVIQTDTISEIIPIIDSDESVEQITIPGFDNVPPALQIKTMSINEVAVKHSGTNIMVHFDVNIPTNPITDEKSSSSLIPIDITKSLTKVYKCQTSILNAILPAELCSILPKMWRNIVDSDQHLSLFTAPIDLPCLTTISEVPMKSDSFINISISSQVSSNTSSFSFMSAKLRNLVGEGYFKRNNDCTSKLHMVNSLTCNIFEEDRLVEGLNRRMERINLFDFESPLLMPLRLQQYVQPKILPVAANSSVAQINTCTALIPYTAPYGSLFSLPKSFSFVNLFNTMATYINDVGLSYFRMIKSNNSLEIKVDKRKIGCNTNVFMLSINKLKSGTINNCNDCVSTSKNNFILDPDNKLLEPSKAIVKVTTGNTQNNNLKIDKVKRRGFHKLYRKCTLSSCTSGEKVTPLHKIHNLEDFFQTLGSAKLLSGVFEGQSDNKIMSYLKEFNNWTTEINPRQALLLILLANKKDTPNLRRFRSMLLQGIAVNRITKAIELDMEIEVIERENLNGVSRFEGISYLPASIENQDSLYEELCWIAKNTASDYQRPFDHTSENLLKSLLEKRKQLNPSYLRVMARYVGLGLMKPPGKRQ